MTAFLYLLQLGSLSDLWAWYYSLGLEPRSPALAAAGLLALWGAFQWGLRRAAGKGVRLVPPAAAP